MKKFSLMAIFFLSLSAQTFASVAVDQLSSLIKPGTYYGSYNNQECSFSFSTNNGVAFLELNTDGARLTHKFTDHDGIVFKEWRGDFMSNYIHRTRETTNYSMDTFRILKNNEYTYLVIEKMFVNNRQITRQKIECQL